MSYLFRLFQLADKVCILPIVGNVDTYRAKKIRERTLVRVNELKATQLIIDISGVPYVDTAVVNHLFKIVKGIKLLGCSTILTGISPEIADTMIELGVEIDNELKTLQIYSRLYKPLVIFIKKGWFSISRYANLFFIYSTRRIGNYS